MKRLLRCGLVATLCALPQASLAVDGAFVRGYASGNWQVFEYFLCDGIKTAGANCAEFDLHARSVAGETYYGLPVYYVIDVASDDCSAPAHTVVPLGRDTAGGATTHTLPGAPATMTLATNNSYTPNPSVVTHRFLFPDITVGGVTCGANGLRLLLRLFYERP